jgi:hypothetical protein
MSEGKKFDDGKNRMALVDPLFVVGVAEVMSFGAQKYSDNSWQFLENAESRYKDALLRHIYAYLSGESNDSESGLSHLKHAAANIQFLSYFDRNKVKTKCETEGTESIGVEK